ncbi:hypothetical protein IRT45_35975 [Nocardia sp. BSTN01]|nr:hypothetical protein [Nocardia sp. BSTN01]MBF5002514.1 hypothetical protein [Nocardia sp. BSTN01]
MPQRLERHLSRTEKNELIQAYRDGVPAAEFARRYHASKSAILELLAKRKIPRRYQSMTDAGIKHAEKLYLAGHSLTACATLTRFPASSINRALNKRGTPGPPRCPSGPGGRGSADNHRCRRSARNRTGSPRPGFRAGMRSPRVRG